MVATTTDVRVWGIRTYDGIRGKTYKVRWIVDGRSFCKTHKSKPPAVKHRAELLKAARREVPFDIYSGLPITQTREEVIEATWYDHAVAFMDMKWPSLQPNSRRSLAAALATLTAAMTAQRQRRPDKELCIKALLNWSFNRTARATGNPPPQYAEALAWVRAHSLKVSALNDPRTVRTAYDATLIAPSGKPYGVDTHRNKMKGLTGAIRYAIELGLLNRNL